MLVLYADDDQDDIDLFTDAFRAFPDYTLLSFCNGFELLAFLEQKVKDLPICLIISDINMHLMNGFETLRSLKATTRYNHIPAVLYSTAPQHGIVLPEGGTTPRTFVKPDTFSAMKNTIQQMLDYCHQGVA